MKFNDPNQRPVNGGGPVDDSDNAAARRGVADFHKKWGWMIAPGQSGQPKDINLNEAKQYEDHRKQLRIGTLQPHEVPPHISKIANVTRDTAPPPTLNYKDMGKKPSTVEAPSIDYSKFNTPVQKVPESQAPTINYKNLTPRPDTTNAPVIDYSKFKKSDQSFKPNANGHEFHVLANSPGREHEVGAARWHKVSHIDGDNYHLHGHSSPVSGNSNVVTGEWLHPDAAKSRNIGLSNRQSEGMKFNTKDTAHNSKDFAKADNNGQWTLNKARTEGWKKGEWFHSGTDKKRKYVELKIMEEAEAKKEQKVKDEEAARVANITNPFTGSIDSFTPEQAAQQKQRISDASVKPMSNRDPSLSSSGAEFTPKLEYSMAAQNQAKADASYHAAHEANRQSHMSDVLSGKKPPATVWEKAVVVAHMKSQLNQPKAQVPGQAKTSGNIVVRRKPTEGIEKSEDVTKADSEMAFSNITELQHHIRELKNELKPGEKLPEWVEAKLTLATDYLSTISHYVDGARDAGRPLDKAEKERLEILKCELQKLKVK